MSQQAMIEELKSNYGDTCHWIGEVDGDIYMIHLLMFHCAVLVNPAPIGGADHRYCFHNPDLALKAILEVGQYGRLRYWKKDHTNNLSVGCGNKLFKPGVPHEPEHAYDSVDWDISDYDAKYPYALGLL